MGALNLCQILIWMIREYFLKRHVRDLMILSGTARHVVINGGERESHLIKRKRDSKRQANSQK